MSLDSKMEASTPKRSALSQPAVRILVTPKRSLLASPVRLPTPQGTTTPFKAMRRRPDGSFEQDDRDCMDLSRSSERSLLGAKGYNDENQNNGATPRPRRVHHAVGLTPPQHSRRLIAPPSSLRFNDGLSGEIFTEIDPAMFDVHRKNKRLAERLAARPEPVVQERRPVDPRSSTPRATIFNPKPTPLAFKTPTRTPKRPTLKPTTTAPSSSLKTPTRTPMPARPQRLRLAPSPPASTARPAARAPAAKE